MRVLVSAVALALIVGCGPRASAYETQPPRPTEPQPSRPRACKAEDWRQLVVASLGAEPIHQEDAVRQAAEWARDNLGLEFIATGLRSAITRPRRIKLAGR